MPEANNLREAERLMTICNSCRYCEGLCAVFPAMERRRVFATGDLTYLANLCHSCGACYDNCQFTPPHEFAVNVPRAMSNLRRESWERYAWPAPFAVLFRRNFTAVATALALCIAGFLIGLSATHPAAMLLRADGLPGAFYRLMPHAAMALLFGGATLFALLALAMGVRHFWQSVNLADPLNVDAAALLQAIKDTGSLRYLGGGGAGCYNESEQPGDTRRLFHHLTFYGFLLCFAATLVATLYHYLLGREAPYAWYDLPVLLGTTGGTGLIIGPAGLAIARHRRRGELKDAGQSGMDSAFILMLLLTSLTGLALLLLRATPAMGVVLALHLGVVFALLVTMPYSRFVHGIYRFAALLRYALERRNLH